MSFKKLSVQLKEATEPDTQHGSRSVLDPSKFNKRHGVYVDDEEAPYVILGKDIYDRAKKNGAPRVYAVVMHFEKGIDPKRSNEPDLWWMYSDRSNSTHRITKSAEYRDIVGWVHQKNPSNILETV